MSANTRAEAFAPATMANLGVGFDILGLAVEGLGDTVIVERRNEPGVVVLEIEGDGGKLPREADKNTAAIAVVSVLKTLKADYGVSIRLKKGLPLASGLGSSAASAAAAAFAVNALAGQPLRTGELLPACLDAEATVSGYHADNVGPSLLGGITLITGTKASEIYQLPIPENLHFALVTPDVAVPTAEARAVLPKTVPLHDLVAQTGAVARLIHALYQSDVPAIAAAMEADGIIEPARAHLMPLLAEARFEAKRAGAFGLVISGAGPTLAAVCDSAEMGSRVAAALYALYENAGIAGLTHVTQVSQTGARLL